MKKTVRFISSDKVELEYKPLQKHNDCFKCKKKNIFTQTCTDCQAKYCEEHYIIKINENDKLMRIYCYFCKNRFLN